MKSPGHDPGQVSIGKTSASKPFEDASLTVSRAVKTRGDAVFWDKPARCLMTGRVAAGV